MQILEDLKKMPLCFLIASGLIVGGFVINILGFSLPYWHARSSDSFTLYEGLWKRCAGGGDDVTCRNYDENDIILEDWFKATRTFSVLALMASIASLVLVVLYIVLEKLRNQLVYIIGVVLCFVTAGCIMLSILIYESHANDLSAGWALSVVALLLYNGAGALLFKEIGTKKVAAT